MKPFEYALPETESEALEFLSTVRGRTEVLAGGTDLIPLMQSMLLTPDRVVALAGVRALGVIEDQGARVRIGAMVKLARLLDSPELEPFRALRQAVESLGSQQLQAQGTLGGELCQKPHCWYFRNGGGLLADRGRAVVAGDNRYHAILGNSGPAKFVSASRTAPALIALGATVRLIGPQPGEEQELPLEELFRAPRQEQEGETVLRPGQIVTHLSLPAPAGWTSAHYDVRHGTGPDDPLASAAAALWIESGRVIGARVVLGQVAPTPWLSDEAAQLLLGQRVSQALADAAGNAAVAAATPLSENRYKVQLARVAVKRAVLLAAGLETGGF
jgi:xanthine dehydrogenase YagS FAD-binding subunit